MTRGRLLALGYVLLVAVHCKITKVGLKFKGPMALPVAEGCQPSAGARTF